MVERAVSGETKLTKQLLNLNFCHISGNNTTNKQNKSVFKRIRTGVRHNVGSLKLLAIL